MTDIEAIKSKLSYHDAETRLAAYESWFTVIGVLADAYADAGMTKEETLCRWIIRERKIPKDSLIETFYWWWFLGDKVNPDSAIPLSVGESINLNLHNYSDLLECLDRLLSIPDEYLSRFE